MDHYETEAYNEMKRWLNQFEKRDSLIQRTSKNIQGKINNYVPEKFHQIISKSIKGMVETVLNGSEYLPKEPVIKEHLTLKQIEEKVHLKFKAYNRTAIIEGGITGAGGFLLGATDFPLLLSFKMKFLFEVARSYGYDTCDKDERIFLLNVFQLAFSSDKHKRNVLKQMKCQMKEGYSKEMIDWKQFQIEYRDYLDLAKLLQLIPGIGAIVGTTVNHRLMTHLRDTAINCYRMRMYLRTTSKDTL